MTYSDHGTTWNDLKRPTTSKKRTKQPTISKKRPATSKKDLKYLQYADFEITSQFGQSHFPLAIFDCNHSSIASWKIVMEVERQTFIYYHGHLLRDVTLAGYFVNHLDTCKLTFVRRKATLWLPELPLTWKKN